MDNQDLRKLGLKVTLPRLKVLQILETTKSRHLSAEEVYRILLDAGEDVGLATVYRVLTQFEAAGLVKRQNFEGGHSVFELEHGEHHDHLICVKCGAVEEFIDSKIEELQAKVAAKFNFDMTDHSLNIYGICPNCQEKK